MFTKHVVKSCCRTKTFVYELSKPIKKLHLKTFKSSGYVAPPSYITAGVFYVRGNGVTATASFGARKINVVCAGTGCPKQLKQFEQVLKQALMV
jgi:hypothetical protein